MALLGHHLGVFGIAVDDDIVVVVVVVAVAVAVAVDDDMVVYPGFQERLLLLQLLLK